MARRLAGQSAQAVAESGRQRFGESRVVQRGQFGGAIRGAAPYDGIGVRRLRVGQQGQRSFDGEAFPGPAAARQGGMGGGQHRVLAVVAAYVGRARAVGLHGDLAKQRGVALHNAHAVRAATHSSSLACSPE
ncbi:hypothetical protein G6F22_018191 [Rhizopus arrhizus]|nr:hypothetical protein G6F22_018191 [Rhizopus arrhizus]